MAFRRRDCVEQGLDVRFDLARVDGEKVEQVGEQKIEETFNLCRKTP